MDYLIEIRILDTPQEMAEVEQLQAMVWPSDEREIVPAHMLLAAAHNGGLVVGAFAPPAALSGDRGSGKQPHLPPAGELTLVGFVYGFPGLYFTPDGARPKHCSHMMGVHPALRDQGIGFMLKRAQWQMVRHQGLDRITWTYDPLLSRNAYLNIARLGAVCNTYFRDAYGEMRDALNQGIASDRFQVDWWVNSQRVSRRLSRGARRRLDLANFLAAGTPVVNPSQVSQAGLPVPDSVQGLEIVKAQWEGDEPPLILLLEIPPDFQALKAADRSLAQAWRQHTRLLFEELFNLGYLVTDFIYVSGSTPRSYYVLSYGEGML